MRRPTSVPSTVAAPDAQVALPATVIALPPSVKISVPGQASPSRFADGVRAMAGSIDRAGDVAGEVAVPRGEAEPGETLAHRRERGVRSGDREARAVGAVVVVGARRRTGARIDLAAAPSVSRLANTDPDDQSLFGTEQAAPRTLREHLAEVGVRPAGLGDEEVAAVECGTGAASTSPQKRLSLLRSPARRRWRRSSAGR